MSRSVQITLVTANFGRGVLTPETRENMQRLHEKAPGAFIGFQEIDEANPGVDEQARLTNMFMPPQTALADDYEFVALHDRAPWKRATPIAVPATWKVVSKTVTLTSDGVKQGTPNRVVVTARCRSVENPDFPEVLFLNGHYPLDHSNRHPNLNATLKQRWHDCQNSWFDHVKALHKDTGLTILTTRDSNHGRGMPKLHASERQLLDAGMIDRISVIPADVGSPDRVTVQVLERKVIDLTIDKHNAHFVRLRLTASRN